MTATQDQPRRGRQRGPDKPNPAELIKLFDKPAPEAIEAEMSLLGAMILDHQVIGDVVQIIQGPEDFAVTSHQAIYKVVVDMYDQSNSVDMIQLNQKLRDMNVLDQVGGLDYLIQLAESVPHAAGAPQYARIVRDKGIIRRLIEAAGQILHDAHNATESAEQVLDVAEKSIYMLRDEKGDGSAAKLIDLLHELYAQLEAREGKYLTGLDTGFSVLNEMTSGLQESELVIIAGRPSMGKTAFALNLAEHIAVTRKLPVAFFSLEMSKQQLAQRLLCSRSGVESHKLRRNTLSGDEFAHLASTMSQLDDAPLYIDDTPGLSLLSLRAKARRLANRRDIKAIFVDYLQLMSAPGSESRQQEVSLISRSLKALARELRMPVVCLSQLNRSPEGREDHRPRMSDLRESGAIEQDADVVMMLHREEYYHNSNPEWAEQNPDLVGTAEVILTKQRNGPTGSIPLSFHGATTRFHDLASNVQAPPEY